MRRGKKRKGERKGGDIKNTDKTMLRNFPGNPVVKQWVWIPTQGVWVQSWLRSRFTYASRSEKRQT